MKARSVLVYSGSVFHGGGENLSKHDRTGINHNDTLGWLRQEENQYLTCPPEIPKDFDRPISSNYPFPFGQRTGPKNPIVLSPDEVPAKIEQITNSRMSRNL